MLNIKQFRNPPSRFAPGYFWSINGRMDADVMISQLKDMAEHGARSVCMLPLPREFRWNSRMEPSYLSPEYHAVVEKVASAADRLGMHWYLYDEGGWPSGSACGQVWASDPGRFSRTYAELDEQGKVRIVKVAEHPERYAAVPDVLVPGVTERFLELTHASYAGYLKKYFGKSIRFAFTDEPTFSVCGPGKLGWTADLPQEFLRRKGYDLLPYVPALLKDMLMPGSRTAEVMLDYREVMADLFEERFLLPIREWCRKNGLLSGGHFGGEDQWFLYDTAGFGNILQSLRALDFPGVDMIWHQLYPGERLHPFPKLASSAAHQNGSRQVLGELFAIYGCGQQPRVMKYLIDFNLFCGINTYVFSSMGLETQDARMSSLSFGPLNTLWTGFGEFHSYVARMSALLAQGKAVVDTALFFDQRSFLLGGRTNEYAVVRALKSADTLWESQCDFDYIDDRLLVSAKLQKGKLVVGKMKYSRLVLPGKCLFSAAGEKKIASLRAAGFPVIDSEDPEALAPLVLLAHPEKALRVVKRDTGNGEFGYFMFNISSRPLDLKITLKEDTAIACADPETGEFFAVESSAGSFDWHFDPWASFYFLTGSSLTFPPPVPGPGKIAKVLDKNWKLRPLWQRFPGENTFETNICQMPAQTVKMGDWRSVLGDDFSGEAVYTVDFRLDDSDRIGYVDLGEVCYASHVCLNGKDLGTRMLGKFVFPVQDALRKGRNHLEIFVANTMANAVNSPEVQKRWKKSFPPSGYAFMQRSFEQESLRSGLFGPVCLREY